MTLSLDRPGHAGRRDDIVHTPPAPATAPSTVRLSPTSHEADWV